jgi:hypothetical protein
MRKSINYSISKIKIKFKKSIEKNDELEQNFIFLFKSVVDIGHVSKILNRIFK